jgi:hypothetical protein
MKTVLSMLVAAGALAATEVLAQAPASAVQSGREVRPPSEAGKASRAARAQEQRPDRRGALNARAQQRAVAPAAFNMEAGASPSTRRAARANRTIVSQCRSSTEMSSTKGVQPDGSRRTAPSK